MYTNVLVHAWWMQDDFILNLARCTLPVVSVLPRGSAVLYDAFAGAALTGPTLLACGAAAALCDMASDAGLCDDVGSS